MKKLLTISFAILLAACAPAGKDYAANDQGMDHSQHASETSSADANASVKARLSASPRHQEWVEVNNNGKKVYTWVVYPEKDGPTPVVILIHENKGLNDWARGMADQVAEAGYIAVAPDLLSGFSATMTRTSDFPGDDEATKALSQLKPEAVMSDLQAVAAWAKAIPSSNGKLVSAGFCWGGGQSFRFAAENKDLDAALVFYGTGPTDATAYGTISAPVFGFYGGADDRVNATIDPTEKNMSAANKEFDYKIYEGAGHAFMRSGEDPSGTPENIAARTAAWERMKEILAKL